MRDLKFKPIKFPEDELPHDCSVEWWYFNGILKDSKGNKYPYMNVLLKFDTKKVDIPFLIKAPKEIYLYHSLLSNLKTRRFHPRINYHSSISEDSFTKLLLYVNYTSHHSDKPSKNILRKPSKNSFHIKTEDFDLRLKSNKKPLLEGGSGYLDLKTKTTYYYSWTNLETEGTININGKKIKVKGKSWMDHQWANTKYEKDKWTWFSIQLNNNTEIVCFKYGEGKNETFLATISYPNNKQVSTEEVIFTPNNIVWKSPKTKAEYPLAWKIEIPSKNIKLEVKPLLKTQEMLFGTINYWEGATKVSGYIDNKKVEGQGFLELMGCPMGISNIKILEKEAEEVFSKSIHKAENKIKRFFRNIKKKNL